MVIKGKNLKIACISSALIVLVSYVAVYFFMRIWVTAPAASGRPPIVLKDQSGSTNYRFDTYSVSSHWKCSDSSNLLLTGQHIDLVSERDDGEIIITVQQSQHSRLSMPDMKSTVSWYMDHYRNHGEKALASTIGGISGLVLHQSVPSKYIKSHFEGQHADTNVFVGSWHDYTVTIITISGEKSSDNKREFEFVISSLKMLGKYD